MSRCGRGTRVVVIAAVECQPSLYHLIRLMKGGFRGQEVLQKNLALHNYMICWWMCNYSRCVNHHIQHTLLLSILFVVVYLDANVNYGTTVNGARHVIGRVRKCMISSKSLAYNPHHRSRAKPVDYPPCDRPFPHSWHLPIFRTISVRKRMILSIR